MTSDFNFSLTVYLELLLEEGNLLLLKHDLLAVFGFAADALLFQHSKLLINILFSINILLYLQ